MVYSSHPDHGVVDFMSGIHGQVRKTQRTHVSAAHIKNAMGVETRTKQAKSPNLKSYSKIIYIYTM